MNRRMLADREIVEDKAYERFGSFISIVTAEQEIYRILKGDLQNKHNKRLDETTEVYPRSYTKAQGCTQQQLQRQET